jgi:hypothetical protein
MNYYEQIEKLLKSQDDENIQLAVATIESKLTKENSIAFFYILKKYSLEAEIINEFIKTNFSLTDLSNQSIYKVIVANRLAEETAELFLINEIEVFNAIFEHAGYKLPSFTTLLKQDL